MITSPSFWHYFEVRLPWERAAVRDEARKAAVIAAAQAEAQRLGAPQERIADLWEVLVESSIAYEFEQWDAQGWTSP